MLDDNRPEQPGTPEDVLPVEDLVGRTAILHTYPKPYNGWRGKIIRKTNSKSFPEYAVEVQISDTRSLVTYANRNQLELVD